VVEDRWSTVSFTVTGASSGETVLFGFSLTGAGSGPCFDALGGLCVDLLPPIELLGVDPADQQGLASLSFVVPQRLPPLTASSRP
jgi:hypothetical protein